jgi:hypothetical protein
VALVLLALYARTVLIADLPVRLGDPAWQLRTYIAVVSASAFPLVELGLLHLASDQDQTEKPRPAGRIILSSDATNQLERQERIITSLRQAVQQAGSVTAMQQRFLALLGPTFGPAKPPASKTTDTVVQKRPCDFLASSCARVMGMNRSLRTGLLRRAKEMVRRSWP